MQIDQIEVTIFKDQLKEATISPLFVHLPYLPNLAAKHSRFYERSLKALAEDLRRSETLSAAYLVTHMGSRFDSGEGEAIDTLASSINWVFRKIENRVVLLLENMSGQGSQIGWRLVEIARVIERVEDQGRIGVCFDTAHAFGAGYDVSNRKGLDATLKEFDRFVGLEKLFLIHLNDTKVALGSRKDRHWHIGKGRIGLEGFRKIVNDPRLSHLPGIMETPRKNDQEDLDNMKTIRSLVAQR